MLCKWLWIPSMTTAKFLIYGCICSTPPANGKHLHQSLFYRKHSIQRGEFKLLVAGNTSMASTAALNQADYKNLREYTLPRLAGSLQHVFFCFISARLCASKGENNLLTTSLQSDAVPVSSLPHQDSGERN